MSFAQTSIGVTFLGGVLLAASNAVIPPAPRIQVHSLTYEAGVVHQERTVRVGPPATVFWAQWQAEVIDAETEAPVRGCVGNGSWNYAEGYRVFDIPLGEWVGQPITCTPDILPARFYLRASWYWGEDQTSKESAVYERATE